MPIHAASARKSSLRPGESDSPFGSFIFRASDEGIGSGAERTPSFAASSAFFTNFAPRRGPDSFLAAIVATIARPPSAVNPPEPPVRVRVRVFVFDPDPTNSRHSRASPQQSQPQA